MRDYVEWHDAYDDPGSSLARRLVVVRRRLAEAFALVTAPNPRILSLCGGEGRDVVPVLAAAQRRASALVVELDPLLAQRARDAARVAGVGIEVRTADAGDPQSFEDALPVDILMLCGIFGNISEADIRQVITATPSMLVDGGVVIWTRGGWEPDLRPRVRQWFEDAQFDELSFDGAPEPFGVGVNRLRAGRVEGRRRLPSPLFSFTR